MNATILLIVSSTNECIVKIRTDNTALIYYSEQEYSIKNDTL